MISRTLGLMDFPVIHLLYIKMEKRKPYQKESQSISFMTRAPNDVTNTRWWLLLWWAGGEVNMCHPNLSMSLVKSHIFSLFLFFFLISFSLLGSRFSGQRLSHRYSWSKPGEIKCKFWFWPIQIKFDLIWYNTVHMLTENYWLIIIKVLHPTLDNQVAAVAFQE